MSDKEIEAEIKALKSKLKNDLYEDMETQQQIYELIKNEKTNKDYRWRRKEER